MSIDLGSTGSDVDQITLIDDETRAGGTVVVADPSENRWRDVLAGTSRLQAIPTFMVALLATAIISVPLWLQASDVPTPPNVALPGGIVVVTTDADLQPLNEATIAGRALVSYIGDNIDAVAFNLAHQDGDLVSERVDSTGPRFDFLTDDDGEPLALDTKKLDNGVYELLVAVTDAEGTESVTAALFAVDNP